MSMIAPSTSSQQARVAEVRRADRTVENFDGDVPGYQLRVCDFYLPYLALRPEIAGGTAFDAAASGSAAASAMAASAATAATTASEG
jgi:hypothetical protein